MMTKIREFNGLGKQTARDMVLMYCRSIKINKAITLPGLSTLFESELLNDHQGIQELHAWERFHDVLVRTKPVLEAMGITTHHGNILHDVEAATIETDFIWLDLCGAYTQDVRWWIKYCGLRREGLLALTVCLGRQPLSRERIERSVRLQGYRMLESKWYCDTTPMLLIIARRK